MLVQLLCKELTEMESSLWKESGVLKVFVFSGRVIKRLREIDKVFNEDTSYRELLYDVTIIGIENFNLSQSNKLAP